MPRATRTARTRKGVKSGVDDKAELLNASPRMIEEALMALARPILGGDIDQERVKSQSLTRLLGETMALADLMGRRRTLLEADALSGGRVPVAFSLRTSDLSIGWEPDRTIRMGLLGFTWQTFKEAVSDLLQREPRLAKSSKEVEKAYTEHHGFAVRNLPAAASDQARLTLTRRIRDVLATALEKGKSLLSMREKLSEIGGFTKAYAENVYRTNLATAFTAGRMRQLHDPEVQRVVPAFEFTAVGDSNTRENHRAASGFIAGIDHPEWQRIAPPIGFQ